MVKSNIRPINIGSNNNSNDNINQQNQSPSNHHSSTKTSFMSESNIDNDNHSLSIATLSTGQSHQNQIVKYSIHKSFQDLLQQAKHVYKIRTQNLPAFNIYLQTSVLLFF